MPISLDPLPLSPSITAKRPLAGMTVLVVEDSRFASEAVRLLCLKSGARIRRADSLRAARRHLAGYVPTVVISDLGLPDGSGIELIRDLNHATQRIPAIFATSGDDRQFPLAMDAGADGVLRKPIECLATFQNSILETLPQNMCPDGLRLVTDERVSPDPIALKDDLSHIAEMLTTADDDETVDYVAKFLAGVARSARDADLEEAAQSLAQRRQSGGSFRSDLAKVAGLLQDRIETRTAI